MTAPRILLDCDPGIDDAFAIFCATRYTDLAAVTTVSGNVRIEHTTRNALHVLDLAGAEVPVHRGASVPLVVPAMFADEVHGVAGLGATETPVPQQEPSPVGAVEAILDFCDDGDANIVATGPLTNIALAVQEDPTISDRVKRLHWMGGSTTTGNTTPNAEFNAWADPHAVEVVLQSGMPITMYGLNLTRQVRMRREHITVLADAATTSSVPASAFLSFYATSRGEDELGQPMHDPCALLGLTHPELFTVEASSIVAHGEGDLRGMTEEVAPNGSPVHHIARFAEATPVIDLIIAAAIDPARST
ncbi:MAG: nucleoside hydrolase [Acidimicrobiia bacterium]|nr:nucleoside hydrolase [Acidimicrobiia bacterium]